MAYSSIIDVFYQLENLEFFDIVLPFLLIFAVVYGILTYLGIFGKENKAVSIIVAVVLGLLSVRLPFFSQFLAEITPRLGVGLSILLALIILVGLFTPKKSRGTITWILFAVGAIIAIIILIQTETVLGGYGSGYFSEQLIGWVVMIAILIGVIVAVTAGKGGKGSSGPPAPLWRMATEEDTE